MSVYSSTNLTLSAATVSRCVINQTGPVTIPSQPGFGVMSGHATASGADVVPGSTVRFNTGSHYNNSNGRFTAPVAGVYYVRFNQLANHANTGEFRTAIYRNGAGYGGARFITHKVQGMWWSLIADAYMSLAANDYVTVRYESGSGALYTDANYASFSGHLMG